ncbi:MAG: NAD(+) synthase [Chloroflexi bacterium]|nr:NAD(+) synthase [Chloroflexota bacterium]
MEELANRITAWIAEKVTGAKCKGVVFGLSGGLDSSVVGVLCKRAFPEDTLAVVMPCYSSDTDIAHAQAVARKFQIPAKTIALEGVFDSLLKVLPVAEGDSANRRMAEANLKVRLRMLTLYYLANRLRYLVVGTGNRSEISVGYFTKYGDGGVDIMPLGNLVKSQVRQLAIYLGIPEEIIDKPPSAGLWAGQTDEGEMGITYQELDHYLTTGEAGEETKKRVDAMVEGSAHKRSTPAIPPF